MNPQFYDNAILLAFTMYLYMYIRETSSNTYNYSCKLLSLKSALVLCTNEVSPKRVVRVHIGTMMPSPQYSFNQVFASKHMHTYLLVRFILVRTYVRTSPDTSACTQSHSPSRSLHMIR